MSLDVFLFLLFALELYGFFRFYSTAGTAAIYCSWYAFIIDTLAILSGTIIMSLAIFVEHRPELFNFEILPVHVLVIFLLGSWQTSIHAIKLYLRNRRHRTVCL